MFCLFYNLLSKGKKTKTSSYTTDIVTPMITSVLQEHLCRLYLECWTNICLKQVLTQLIVGHRNVLNTVKHW